jgi:7,8-dihydropterin-6-yl-methyl-4-(beta-D-ribofuranosyl)aminobenzene 5'-phosphate synthase
LLFFDATTDLGLYSRSMNIPLEPIDSVSVTALVDNVSDMLLMDQGPAKRPGLGTPQAPRVPAATLETGETTDALLAEHGFSALISVAKNGSERRVLFDSGLTPDGVAENMRRLTLSPKDMEAIVLSHGHFDHTTGIDGLVRTLGRANLPVIIHPEFWTQRRLLLPGREPFEIPSTSRSALLGAGFEIIEEKQPSFLLDRSLLITGEVDRTTEFEKGFPVHQAKRNGEWQADPLILDDQAAVLNVRDKGLVVITGCGHAGIVNILRYARKLTGVEGVYAVIGGFHLNGPLFEPIIPTVCDALAELDPQVIVPAHCTGWKAVHAIAARFPDAFIQNSVGTRFEL